MNFGDKLKSLRKEHGYSQEAFAQQLDMTRQAVSKWESGQGYPETDKLIQISNMFGVTLDYLLKENIGNKSDLDGFYVSKEMLDGYLFYNRQKAKYIAMGISIFLITDVFSYIFEDEIVGSTISWVLRAVGISLILWQKLIPDKYRALKHNQLLIDRAIIKDFKIQHEINIKRYIASIIVGIMFLFLSSPIQHILSEEFKLMQLSNVIQDLMLAAAFGLFFLAGISLKAEMLIFKHIENDENKPVSNTK